MPRKNCLNCNDEFMWYPSQSKGKYCSNECGVIFILKEKIKSGTYTKSNALSYFRRFAEYKCTECGISEYNEKSIRLQIDHIDGNNKNNKIENFRYLCPNCHSQTDTWGVRNASEEGKKRMREAAILGNAIQNGRVPKGTKLL